MNDNDAISLLRALKTSTPMKDKDQTIVKMENPYLKKKIRDVSTCKKKVVVTPDQVQIRTAIAFMKQKCPVCLGPINIGDYIRNIGDGWKHDDCAPIELCDQSNDEFQFHVDDDDLKQIDDAINNYLTKNK